ncbi:MAG: peroxiredoxin-like family protein [Spirochaetota bacterium]
MIKPETYVPELQIHTLDGETWSYANYHDVKFSMIVFYRGYHCPICKTYLKDLQSKLDEFHALGIETIAISSDSKERAEKTRQEWGLDKLKIGYEFSLEEGKKWGLFLSKGIKEGEPELFTEPGLFLIKPDQRLYASSVQTMPFSRPHFSELLTSLNFIIKIAYPARGEA